MNKEEKLEKYEYSIVKTRKSINEINEHIQRHLKTGHYADQHCILLRGKLVAYKETLYRLTGNISEIKQ